MCVRRIQSMDIYTFLVVSHIIGTVLGVGSATFAEIFYMRAMKDGEVDPEEGATLKIVYRIIRIGLFLAVFSGFGFLLYYRLIGSEYLLYDPKLWAKMAIVIIIMINAIMLTTRSIAFWLGSAISITSWYAALILGSWRTYPYSFVQTMVGYIISVAVMVVVLHFVRKWYLNKV